MEEEKKGKGFVVKDRRLFGESGEMRAEDPEKLAATEETKADAETEKADAGRPAAEENAQLPEINFANFILSLGTTAFYHFGDLPDQDGRTTDKNLAAAKQTIDLLTLLKSKTEGNLDHDEQALLDGMLYELRMRYVKETAAK